MISTHQYVARILIEAEGALAVGSGEKGFTVDKLVARDAMNLPYIPGTSLAGVLRHEMGRIGEDDTIMDIFGFQENQAGQGSRLAISSAQLTNEDGKTAIEGLSLQKPDNTYLNRFKRLPERDHVRIGHRGVAENHGKYDEELVPKGARFVFTMRLSGNAGDEEIWHQILAIIQEPLFRIGSGTRKGYGKLKVKSCEVRTFDLTNKSDLLGYLEWDNSLNAPLNGEQFAPVTSHDPSGWVHYSLELTPQKFFLFAAGYGDEDADIIPQKETYLDWSAATARWMEQEDMHALIPATSVKGTIAHRVAWHYNRLNKACIMAPGAIALPPQRDLNQLLDAVPLPVDVANMTAGSNDPEWEGAKQLIENYDFEKELRATDAWKAYELKLNKYREEQSENVLPVGSHNFAVKTLFGEASNQGAGARGNVILSDVYLKTAKDDEKTFCHVAIDRFTGGARDGMLFQEKVVTASTFCLDFFVKKEALADDLIRRAFEESLEDICHGRLPLGANTQKGHGVFNGVLKKSA